MKSGLKPYLMLAAWLAVTCLAASPSLGQMIRRPGQGGGGGSVLIGPVPSNTPPPTPRPPSQEDIITVEPGSGFSGPTVAKRVGARNAPGGDAKVIARWDMVPYQTFAEDLFVGVVAFHINGIEKVDFSVEGGPWMSATQMQFNPQSGVWEYVARVRIADLRDGPVEIRAIAWPRTAGLPRVLSGPQSNDRGNGECSLNLIANGRGTVSPRDVYVSVLGDNANSGLFQQLPKRTLFGSSGALSVAAASQTGAVVHILDGDVWEIDSIGSRVDNTRLITIKGVDRNVTVLRPRGAQQSPWAARGFLWPQIRRIKYENVGFDFSYIKQITSNQNDTFVWLDQCRIFNVNGWGEPSNVTYFSNSLSGGGCSYYATNSLAEDCVNGFTDHVLTRGCHNRQISGDVFQNSRMVVKCTADYLSQDVPTDQHTDVFQQFRPGANVENIIAYEVQCTRMYGVQNWLIDTANSFRDMAYVNIAIQNLPVPQPYQHISSELNVASQLTGPYNHVLFLNVSAPGRRILFHDELPSWSCSNFKFVNCVLDTIQDGRAAGGLPSGISVVNCYIKTLYRGIRIGSGTVLESEAGAVTLDFTAPAPSGTFSHTGPGASSLAGSGLPVPGFSVTTGRGAFIPPPPPPVSP